MPLDRERLKTLRAKAKLTQQALADAVGMTRRETIAELENGTLANPRLSTLEAVAAALGVHVRRLLS